MGPTASSTPVDVTIECRRPSFDFSASGARYWNDNSAVKTFFWNALSLGLPQLEHAAVKTINAVLPQLEDDPVLQRCAQAFCMQESQHAIQHDTFNASAAAGRRPRRWEQRTFALLLAGTSHRFVLGLFSGIEHFTSIIAHAGLARPARWFANSDPEVFRLWHWHAVEELEHKSVCFDVYRKLGGGWLLRATTMLIATLLILAPAVTARLLAMLWRDSLLRSPSTWRDIARVTVGRDGVLQTVFRDYLSYFRVGFHPWEQDSRALILDWKPGAAPP